MKTAKTIILGLTLAFISTNALSDEMSNQKMMCEFDGKEILITAPMPDDWSQAQKEEACKSICESIRYAEPMIIIRKATKKEAVCDTDYNCEILWEKYHKFNIKSIFTAPDNRQRKGVNVLEVKCTNSPITKYTAVEEELPSICQGTINILDAIEDEAKVDGKATEFKLDWNQLEAAIEANMIPNDRSTNNSPTTAEFVTFMKMHQDAEVSGIYRNEKGATDACKISNQSTDKNSECIKNNSGIIITDITIRFGESDEIPKWFNDFCKNADDITKYTYGFWQCTW